MAEFRFVTSGDMNITLEGLRFGRQIRDPEGNIKSFIRNPTGITLNAADQNHFTCLGIVELLDPSPSQRGCITVTLDSPNTGWYATAQIQVIVNGHFILNDNFQSGTRGPVGDPRRTKRYPIDFIG